MQTHPQNPTQTQTTQRILEVRGLEKHYRSVQAVNGVSFSVPAGICFGLLGPNGAGKTTTIEMMEGILTPSSGQILYKGQAQGERFRHEAGIQFQATALQDFLTVREQLKLFQSFYNNPLAIDEVVELCALQSYLDRDASRLSGGQRQRLLLAIALINDPSVVFLDEPTTGLDPQARLNFWGLVKRIKAAKKTVLLTTHYMEEAHHLCDEIAIMDQGKIIAQGAPDALLAEHFQNVVLELAKEDCSATFMENMANSVLDYHIIEGVRPTLEINTNDVNGTVQHLLAQGVSLQSLKVRSATLEDLFLELTGKALRS